WSDHPLFSLRTLQSTPPGRRQDTVTNGDIPPARHLGRRRVPGEGQGESPPREVLVLDGPQPVQDVAGRRVGVGRKVPGRTLEQLAGAPAQRTECVGTSLQVRR